MNLTDTQALKSFPKDFERYKELLKCNLQGREDFPDDDIFREFAIYDQAIENWNNYPNQIQRHGLKLPSDGGVYYEYPNIHPFHQKICDLVKEYNVKDVCDVGAGFGQVSKYIAATNPGVSLTCIEGSKTHIELMRETFSKEQTQFEPIEDVTANIIEGIAQNIPIPDRAHEFVFTNTVLMHIPFYMAVQAITEVHRISNKFICHIERKDGNIVMGHQISNNCLLNVDYMSIYTKLGVKPVIYEEFPYPNAGHCTAILYLGVKF